jgi:hypothetical protein
LDEAVAVAYGWPVNLPDNEVTSSKPCSFSAAGAAFRDKRLSADDMYKLKLENR